MYIDQTDIVSLQDLQKKLQDNRELLNSRFVNLKKRADELFVDLDDVFKQHIDTDIISLQNSLIHCSSLSYTLGQTVADAKELQQLFEALCYMPKSDKYSEADRKLLIKTLINDQTLLVQRLASAEEKLDKRITIIQSVLKSENTRLGKMIEDDDQSLGTA